MTEDWRAFELEEEIAKPVSSGQIDEDITLLVFFASGGPGGVAG